MFQPANDARPIGQASSPALGSLKGDAKAAAVNALQAKAAVAQSASFDSLQARRNSWANETSTQQIPSASSSSGSGLKWRSAKTAETTSAATTPDAVAPAQLLLSAPTNAVAGGAPEICTEDCQVEVGIIRQVSNEQEVDPFNDPFGDGMRVAQRPRTAPRFGQPTLARNNQPTPAAPPAGQVQPNRPETTIPPPPTTPLNPPPMGNAPGIGQDLFPGPGPGNMLRPDSGDSPAPGFNSPSMSDRPRSNCDRVYNDRDCCETDRLCNAARLFIHDADIRKISIDITPRFKPDAPNWNEDYASRDEQLKKAESRQWHDRAGNVVVQGRLLDLAQGKAVIQSDGGTIQRVSLNTLAEDELCFINGWWNLPSECVAGGLPYVERCWTPATFAYTASGVCHKPLYFEDVQAERYGHVAGPFLQPVLSSAHFFLNVAALPYNMAIHPPNECQYALGYYRPGSCAPWMVPPIPLSLKGALAEAGVIVGGIYLLP